MESVGIHGDPGSHSCWFKMGKIPYYSLFPYYKWQEMILFVS